MTTTAPAPDRAEPTTEVDRARSRRWPHVLVLLACASVLLYSALRVASHDPTDLQVSGDQAAFVLQAVSISGGDLSYDEQDYAGWLDLEWESQPRGLFLQRNEDGWAFAKPYGYSLLLAPAIDAFGAEGVSVVNAGLLLAYAWCWYAVGRTRWRPPASAVVATAATVGSNAWAMAFPAHADLFVAVVVGVVVVATVRIVIGPAVRRTDGAVPRRAGGAWVWLWPCIAAFGTGVLVTEKLPALLAVGPLLAVALWRTPVRARLLAAAVGVVVVAVSVVPYLYYSDGASWNAYGGDRYYTPGSSPFTGGTEENLRPWETKDDMSPQRVFERITDPSGDIPSAALTYVIGRHTGAITNQPVIGALGVAILLTLWRRRRAGSGDGSTADDTEAQPGERDRWCGPALLAAATGLAAYVALYLVTFTDNYFGGGQSVGNRYFLQISVLVAVLPVAARIGERAAAASGVIGGAVAFALITPHLWHADDAFFHLERTTRLQMYLPFETSQSGNWRLQCGPGEPCFPGNSPVSGG
jgi:hypothetical protein